MEQRVATVDGGDDAFPALGIAQLEQACCDLSTYLVVILARLNDAFLLSPAHVEDDASHVPIGEGLRVRPIDPRVLLQLVQPVS